MSFIKIVTKEDGQQAAEVFIRKEELLKVLHQQGIEKPEMPSGVEQFCLTCPHSKLEEYD